MHIKDIDRFNKRIEGLYNLSKIIALIFIAIWTIFQWNTTIFPKESFEEFSRKSSLRTDLELEIKNTHINFLSDSKSENKIINPLSIEGICYFSNNKNFPIKYEISKINIRKGIPQKFDSILGFIDWQNEDSIPVNNIFLNTSPIVIEPKGESINSFYFEYYPKISPNEKYYFLKIDIEIILKAINPDTGKIIKQSQKFKYVGLTAKIDSNLNNIFSKSSQLYTRFRASQAFEELEKELEK